MSAILKEVQTNVLTSMVDEFVELDATLKTMEATIKRHTELKQLLASHADAFGDNEARLTGRTGFVIFSKPALNRTINDPAAFFVAVGLENFLAATKVSVTAADKLLTPAQKATLFTTSIGSRRLKIAERISGLASVKN